MIETVKPQIPHILVPIWWPLAFGFCINFIFGSISDFFVQAYWQAATGFILGFGGLMFICCYFTPQIVWRWVTTRHEEFQGEIYNK